MKILYPVDYLSPYRNTIPKCKFPIPKNTFCLGLPVATPIGIPDEFPTKQESHQMLLRARESNRNQGTKYTLKRQPDISN